MPEWRRATEPTYFYNSDNSMEVIYSEGGLATFATVVDTRNPEGCNGVLPVPLDRRQGTMAFPYDADDGHRAESVVADHDHLPATRWPLQPSNVTCQDTGNSAAFSPVILLI